MCGIVSKNPPYAKVSTEKTPKLNRCAADQTIPVPSSTRGLPVKKYGIPKNTDSSSNPELNASETDTGNCGIS
ncbi:hypothetical protein NSED_03905 [Candidatus Nitrosopumilus sediminis]|uniref:Uncharacterized protein n=1 Tax=Candidatus Nitrosopumilus sediminis TaxID=1229909 RepID=K0BBS8_9ARCH|nr:hypothetical protein NSED_03905 [Candidatus Nitrosopumilus sediminis]